MARPKKSIPPAKNREIKIRFTKELYNVLTNEALAARIPRTEYIRQLILDHHPVIKQEVVFDCTKVLEIFRGLGNCRGNLNQIAKHLNQGGEPNGQVRKQVLVSSCVLPAIPMLQNSVDQLPTQTNAPARHLSFQIWKKRIVCHCR